MQVSMLENGHVSIMLIDTTGVFLTVEPNKHMGFGGNGSGEGDAGGDGAGGDQGNGGETLEQLLQYHWY